MAGPAKRIRNAIRPYRDQQFFTDVANQQYRKRSTLNQLRNQRQQTRQQFGFDSNPLSNPYSRAAQLQRSFESQQRGTTAGMAARGQLYAGALTRARDANTHQFGQSWNAAKGEYEQQLSDINQRMMDARTEARMGRAQASQAAMDRALRLRTLPGVAPRGKRGR